MTNKMSTLELKNTPWPKFHHDNRSTGQSPYSSYTDGTLKWSLPLGKVRSSPAIDSDGTIYIGAYNS